MSGNENNKKFRSEIIAVISVAAIIIIVASLFIINHFNESKTEEEFAEQFNEQVEKKLEENAGEAGEIRESLSADIPGSYVIGGESDSQDPSRAFITMQLLPDGKVAARAMDGSEDSGWWTAQEKNGISLVAIAFPSDQQPTFYQYWNSYLISVNSIYYGNVEKSPAFDTTLTSASATGTMIINLTSAGKANGEFTDTNEQSENYGLKYMFAGNYTVDGDIISITLNSATTKFVMFDYDIPEFENDSGIASVFYQKQ